MSRILVFLPLFIFSLSGAAYADDAVESPRFTKDHWKITHAYCPVGCSKDVKTFLSSQIGRSVQVSATSLNAPFLDTCDGAIRYHYTAVNAEDLVNELNKGIKAPSKITLNSLGLKSHKVSGALAYCDDGKFESLLGRILSVEPDRLLFLFEEHSIIELQ